MLKYNNNIIKWQKNTKISPNWNCELHRFSTKPLISRFLSFLVFFSSSATFEVCFWSRREGGSRRGVETRVLLCEGMFFFLYIFCGVNGYGEFCFLCVWILTFGRNKECPERSFVNFWCCNGACLVFFVLDKSFTDDHSMRSCIFDWGFGFDGVSTDGQNIYHGHDCSKNVSI